MQTDCENREYYSREESRIYNSELSIKIQPFDVATKIGAYINLSAVVQSPQPSYQWYNQSGQRIPNKNQSNLLISPVKESDFGFYKLEIVDLITNQRALTRWVEIKNANPIYFDRKPEQTNGMPPQLLAQHQGGLYQKGSTVELTGHFENATAYQWFKDGMELSGCTGNSLKIVDSHLYNTGNYILRASNSYGSITTQHIQVTVH